MNEYETSSNNLVLSTLQESIITSLNLDKQKSRILLTELVNYKKELGLIDLSKMPDVVSYQLLEITDLLLADRTYGGQFPGRLKFPLIGQVLRAHQTLARSFGLVFAIRNTRKFLLTLEKQVEEFAKSHSDINVIDKVSSDIHFYEEMAFYAVQLQNTKIATKSSIQGPEKTCKETRDNLESLEMSQETIENPMEVLVSPFMKVKDDYSPRIKPHEIEILKVD